MKLIIGEKHTLKIEKLVYQGFGLGRIDSCKIFVPQTLPGDTVEVEISQKKKKYVIGKKINTIDSSCYRTESPCPHFPDCGGCQLINVKYKNQLHLKKDILEDCFTKDFSDWIPKIRSFIPSPNHHYYRNKMEFSFGKDEKGVFPGLKKRGCFDQVLRIDQCLLQSKLSNQILKFSAKYFSNQDISVWDYHKHNGLLRHLIIRHAKNTDTYLVNLVISEKKDSLAKNYAKELTKNFPQIVSVYTSINSSKGDSAFSPNPELILGQEYLKENLSDKTFQISPYSFFQTNTKGAELLYENILKAASPKKSDTILDLYSGTGTIGIYLAAKVKQVIGIEEVESNILDAKKNSDQNKINNISFWLGRVKNILKFEKFNPACVITDPPRSGMVPKAILRMAELRSPKIVYVSCNPQAMIRDLRFLTDNGYQLKYIQPIDMFPNTYHMECISLLEFKN